MPFSGGIRDWPGEALAEDSLLEQVSDIGVIVSEDEATVQPMMIKVQISQFILSQIFVFTKMISA